ncbi:hypothetical protein QR685DRAFT_528106 [Neurospora intermedia]|uniref:Uncharacterized protein n=1 Tax=Neurospora intermedia TaxID=5142 RepID=A0ABR3DBE5_NEUIN
MGGKEKGLGQGEGVHYLTPNTSNGSVYFHHVGFSTHTYINYVDLSVGKDHSRHMKRCQLGTLGYPSPSRTQPNHALTRRTSTSTLSLNMKQELSTHTENVLRR